MSDRIAGVLLTAIALGYVILASGFTTGFGDPLGPAMFPRLIGIPAVLLAATLVLWPGSAPDWADGPRLARQVGALATLLGYALILEGLGFVPATFLLVFLMALLMGAKPIPGALLGAVASPALFILFDQLLGLPLPLLGSWFG